VTAYVDRNPIQVDETVQFVVKVNGDSSGGAPDLSSLEHDFDVLGTSQSTQTSIINGRTNTVTQWVSTLAPKHAGSITIQPIQVGTGTSAPLTLTVLQSGKPGQVNKARDVFVDIQVEPHDPYVQSQVTYTVKLYHAVPIHEGRLDEPNSPDVLVQKLGEDRSYETIIDGRRYQVIERQYALFPQKSGTITLPALAFTGQVPEQRRRRSLFDDMMGNRPRMFGNDPFDALFQTTRAVRARGEAVTLTVRPMPPSFGSGHWLPAEEVMLQETWTPEDLDQQALRIGEPLTRTIMTVAKGVTGSQLPEIPVTESDRIKIYPDQPLTDTKVEGSSTIGIRQQKLAFVPTESGEIQLPAIDLPWWDSKSDMVRIAHLPARTLRVLPEVGTIEPTNPAAQLSASSRPPQIVGQDSAAMVGESRQNDTILSPPAGWPLQWWKAGTAVLSVLWVLTCLAWWSDRNRRKSRPTGKQSEAELVRARSVKQAKLAFEQACRDNNPKEAKQALLRWAEKKWPENSPIGLSGIAQRLSDPQAQTAIWELDRLLYAPNDSEWDGRRFGKSISSAMEARDDRRSQQDEVLPPLYLTGT